MKILDCHKICGMTALFLDGNLPLTNWSSLVIDETRYEPHPIMDAGKNVVAIDGEHDFTGKEIKLV